MRAAVFGATGLLGRAVVRTLGLRGHAVVAIAHRAVEDRPGVDLADEEALARLAVDADAVINCAARVPSGPDTLGEHAAMMRANAIGVANLARWAASRGISQLVHGSTLVVASRPWPVPLTEAAPTYPTGPVAGYAASKLAGELLVTSIAQTTGARCAVLRLAALYGPGMPWLGVLPTFIDEALAGRRLRAASGAHADFLHVDDAATAMVRAAEAGATGLINVASGVETSIRHLAELVLAACGRRTDEVDVAETPAARAVVDVTRMHAVLGAAPTPLDRGIEELVALRRQVRT